jgi:hypothetical protein
MNEIISKNDLTLAFKKELNPLTKTAICNICGNNRKMSKDHIFLKALGNKGKVIVKPHHKRFNLKHVRGNDGITFSTICDECNNQLGALYDKPFNDFIVDIIKFTNSVFKTSLKLLSYSACFETIPSHIARSVIGHMLAAKLRYDGPYAQDMRSYVNNSEYTLADKLHLYAWFYCDYKKKALPEYAIPVISSTFDIKIFYIMKSFPVAFVFTDSTFSGEGIVDLLGYLNGEIVKVPIDMLHHPPPNWPESDFAVKQSMIIGANNFKAIEI